MDSVALSQISKKESDAEDLAETRQDVFRVWKQLAKEAAEARHEADLVVRDPHLVHEPDRANARLIGRSQGLTRAAWLLAELVPELVREYYRQLGQPATVEEQRYQGEEAWKP